MSTLTFLGAARTVTGSKHLLDLGHHRLLIDCGLFQGLKELRLKNWEKFPIDPAGIDAVVLTHAHLDHCGHLPRLVAQGFRGRVFCTPGTRELCALILRDSAHIQEEDARHANRHGYSKHNPALPLYTSEDAALALDRIEAVSYGRPFRPFPDVEIDFINAGHLLGSAFVRVRLGSSTMLFGGDLGRYGRPVLPDPSAVASADVLLLESTYGDRRHEPDDDGARLAGIINDTVTQGGRLIIPSFAIGRVEELLYWLGRLERQHRIPALPVYVDSPMAAAGLRFYEARASELDVDAVSLDPSRMIAVASAQESNDLAASAGAAIIIAASGMATGGRVLNHLRLGLTDRRNTILFVGFQAAATRGRQLCNGAKQVKLQGQIVPVAARIEQIGSMSAHADADEIMRWLSGFEAPPKATYLVHGEPPALEALQRRIVAERGWSVQIAEPLQRVETASA